MRFLLVRKPAGRGVRLVIFLSGLLACAAAEPPIDTRYLRDHAETRGFMLGRPGKVLPTPDGTAVVFLRAEPRLPTMRLFEFDVATGRTIALLAPEQLLR